MEYQIIKRAFDEAHQADPTTLRAQSLNGLLSFAHFVFKDEAIYPYWVTPGTINQPDFFVCQYNPDIEHIAFVNSHKAEFWTWLGTFDCLLTSKHFPQFGPKSILFNSLLFSELMWQDNIGLINQLSPYSWNNRLLKEIKNNVIGLLWERGFIEYLDKVFFELEYFFYKVKGDIFLVGGAIIDYYSFDQKLQKKVLLNIFNFLKSI